MGEIALYGSIVRGDFDSDVSDVGFFVVIRSGCPTPEDAIVGLVRGVAEGAVRRCLGRVPVRGVDLALCFEHELSRGCG